MQRLLRLLPLLCAILSLVLVRQGDATGGDARRTENLLVVTTDGLRWQEVFGGADEALLNREHGGVANVAALRRDFWRTTQADRRAALLPFTWEVIAQQGQLFGNRWGGSQVKVTNGLNFSYPGYNELFAGFGDPRINSNDYPPNPNLTVFEWLHRLPRFRGRVAAFCSWEAFPRILNEERSGILVNAGWEPVTRGKITPELAALNGVIRDGSPTGDTTRPDSLTFRTALAYLKAQRPRLLYIALDATDAFAHAGQYDHYLRMAQRVDGWLRLAWETVQSHPQYRGRTTLLVTTDHGRGDAPTGWRHHGRDVAGAENSWIAVLGPDTPALGERSQTATVTQSQVAATIAALLGENYRVGMPHAAPPLVDVLGSPVAPR